MFIVSFGIPVAKFVGVCFPCPTLTEAADFFQSPLRNLGLRPEMEHRAKCEEGSSKKRFSQRKGRAPIVFVLFICNMHYVLFISGKIGSGLSDALVFLSLSVE
jgi:hypothetical protein